MSVFEDRIQASKRTSRNISAEVHLYPAKLLGSNSGLFPNVHAGASYYSNTPHFWLVKAKDANAPRLIVKTSLSM